MIFFYLLALLPIAAGGALWVFNKNINWLEFLAGSVCAFLVAGIMHIVAANGVTDDVETRSGQIVEVRQFSSWREYYEYAVYRTEYYTETEYYTDSKGKSQSRTVTRSREVFSHWQPTTRTHEEHWKAYSNINTEYSVDKQFFLDLAEKFGGTYSVKGDRSTSEHNSRMIGGDPYDYIAKNKTGYIQPVTALTSWTNKIKGAGPSAFSFRKVDEKIPVYDWPNNPNPWRSERVIKANIDVGEWDRMNARLGPIKKVNVIIVNFKDQSSDMAEYQKAKWLQGKKNDLVLVYGEKEGKTTWADCFGWTKSEIVKSNLKTLLLENAVNTNLIPKIEEEIINNYQLRNFEKDFDYLDIEPRPVHYFWAIFLMFLTQGGLWIYFHHNEFKKQNGY